MTRALLLLAAGCSAAASEPRPPIPDVVGAVERLHERVELHAAFQAGKDAWMNLGVHPLPPPRTWNRDSER